MRFTVFSIVIATYGRSSNIVNDTLMSILDDKSSTLVKEIIVVDQNESKLNLDYNTVHIMLEKPSLTKARNLGAKQARNEHLIFFDDDVIVQENTFEKFKEAFELGVHFVAGREILPESFQKEERKNVIKRFKSFIRSIVLNTQPNPVANITFNGFFFCDFSYDKRMINNIDTVRGCIFGVKKSCFHEVQGFDENFQGNALREESDFILRLRANGYSGVFQPGASVLHLRQSGGCDNLEQSFTSLSSKLSNELYFQKKHFSGVSIIVVFFRLLPYALEAYSTTRLKGVRLLIQKIREFRE